MKKIFAALLGTVSAVVLAASYQASLSSANNAETSAAATPAPAASGGGAAQNTSGANDSDTNTNTNTGFTDGNFTGDAVNTRYGAVQVAITVNGGHITDVRVPQYPSVGGREQRVNSNAVPQLVQETLSAQSAHIQMVSGATYTMQGYVTSLQSALDQARA